MSKSESNNWYKIKKKSSCKNKKKPRIKKSRKRKIKARPIARERSRNGTKTPNGRI